MLNLTALAIIVPFILSLLLYPIFIPYLRKIKFSQSIRDDGPSSHLEKTGTPTMGGIVIVFTILFTFVMIYFLLPIEYKDYLKLLLIVLPLVSYFIIGLIDDYLIVIKKNNLGLKPKHKFLLQSIVAIIYFYIYLELNLSTHITLLEYTFNLEGFYGVVIFLYMIGISNAVNLTDGLDGLAGSQLIIIFTVINIISFFDGSIGLHYYSLAIIGALFGFLVFNSYPAKVFMGDTGSLALGGVLGSFVILLGHELLFVIYGFILIVETLSVLLQVMYFKATNGKRIFKMTPIHHHFELTGYKESKVVILFAIVSIIAGVVSLIIYFM